METTLWRRRELESILAAGCAQPLVDRAVDLAIRHGWQVCPARDGRFTANRTTIYTLPLQSEGDFASFLHEAGHIEDRHFDERRREAAPAGFVVSLEAECFAWLWALTASGHRWNVAMHTTMLECLRGYATTYRRVYVFYGRDLRQLEAVIEHSRQQAAHIVRLHAAPPVSPLIAQLLVEIEESI